MNNSVQVLNMKMSEVVGYSWELKSYNLTYIMKIVT